VSLKTNCSTLLALVAVTLAENWVYGKAGEFTKESTLTPAKVAEKSFGVPVSTASQKDTL
jgi:hypothetical protein